MKKIIVLISFMIILLASSVIAEVTNVTVKRVGENLYKTDTGLYIETRDCEEMVIGNKAVLKYDKNSENNEIIFENGSSYAVVVVFKL